MARTRLILWFLAAHLAAICMSGSAFAERRVALVIGNSTYAHAPALCNPSNDARAIAALLKQSGFDDVALKHDLGFDGMRLALRDFGLSTRGADVAVVYFAGHGLELGGENFLVPVDASLKSASSVAFEAATLSAVLDAIRPAGRLRLVILDACRINPMAARLEMAGGLTRSVPRGLGRIEPTGDVLVAYAAKAGTVAGDGKGTHSPYAEALLSTLGTPGLDIRLVMGRVRDLVLAKTAGAQEPFVYGSLGGSNVTLISLKQDDAGAVSPVSPDASAARDYELAAKFGTKEAWDAYLAAHPKGFHAELARVQRSKLKVIEPPSRPKVEQNASLDAKPIAPPRGPFDGKWTADNWCKAPGSSPGGSKNMGLTIDQSSPTTASATYFGYTFRDGRISGSEVFFRGNRDGMYDLSGRLTNPSTISGTFKTFQGFTCTFTARKR